MPIDREFIRGQIAAQLGKGRETCPYSPSSDDGKDWLKGWFERRRQIERRSGAMRARTLEMRAQAEAEIGAQPYNRPDPALAILNSVHDPDDPWYCGEPLPPRPRPENGFQILGKALSQAATQISQTFVTAFSPTVKSLMKLFDPPPSPYTYIFHPDDYEKLTRAFFDRAKVGLAKAFTDEKLRHGYAAVCPVHGDTKGGTCMPCTRQGMKREDYSCRGRVQASSRGGGRSSSGRRSRMSRGRK